VGSRGTVPLILISDQFKILTTLLPIKYPWYSLNRSGATHSQSVNDKILPHLAQTHYYTDYSRAMRFFVFTVLYPRNPFFWDVILCCWVGGSQFFIETCHLIIKCSKSGLEPFKIRVTSSCEMLGTTFPATQPHIPEDQKPLS